MHPIAISNDITLTLAPPVSMHMYFGLQGELVPTAPALDFPAPMYWPPGFALGANKLTTTVLHKSMPIVLDGHDCGPQVLHLQLAPDGLNTLTPIHILFSSRKVNFFTSDKVADGKCLGVAKLLAWPPAPMTSCGEPVSLAGTGVPTTALNSVVLDLKWIDAVIGWGTIALTVTFELALSTWGAAPTVSRMMLNKLGVGDRALGKQGIAMLSGAARLALTDGPAQFKPTVGSPYLSVGLGVSRDEDGNYSMSADLSALHRSWEVGKDGESFYSKSEERSSDDVLTVECRPGQKTDYSHDKLSTQLDSWGESL
jgi:hypothetical protein